MADGRPFPRERPFVLRDMWRRLGSTGRKRPACLAERTVNGPPDSKPLSDTQGRSRSFPQGRAVVYGSKQPGLPICPANAQPGLSPYLRASAGLIAPVDRQSPVGVTAW